MTIIGIYGKMHDVDVTEQHRSHQNHERRQRISKQSFSPCPTANTPTNENHDRTRRPYARFI
ncbi:MAG: hypothetical protein ACLU4B_04885 [Bilophila wadsworthia]